MLCPDCGVLPGQLHRRACEVECCPRCETTWMNCECEEHSTERVPWSGEVTGADEALEAGLDTRLDHGTGENVRERADVLTALVRLGWAL